MPFALSQFIEACRWVGALLVLAVHSTNAFVNLGDISSAPHAFFVHAWNFLVSYEIGHQAVVGFFAISGYLVGGAVLAHMRKNEPFLREYFIHRFTRIYVVLAPAVVLTLLIDTAGRAVFANESVYDWPALKDHFSPLLLVTTLINQQTIYFDYFGSNSALWSLACEFWYYVTFPLLLLPFARCYSVGVRAAGFALGVAALVVLSIPAGYFKLGYVIWALGAFATQAKSPLIGSRRTSIAIYCLLLVAIRLLVRGPNLIALPMLQDIADLVSAGVFLNLALSTRFGPVEGLALFRPRFHKPLADFSYSLYGVHMPLLIFARASADRIFGAKWGQELATPGHWLAMAGIMLVAIVAGYVFSRFTEAHTSEARNALRTALLAFGRAGATQAATR